MLRSSHVGDIQKCEIFTICASLNKGVLRLNVAAVAEIQILEKRAALCHRVNVTVCHRGWYGKRKFC
jgi:hypothetical protein